MLELAARPWSEIAAESGFRVPVTRLPWLPFCAAWLAGSALAFALGASTGIRAEMSLALLASIVLVQPVVEELLFRGLLQGYLVQTALGSWSVRGITIANAATSAIFAATHLVYQPPLWAAGVFIPSLVFGYFRDRTGSVLPAVLLHVTFNALFFSGRILS